MLDLCLPLLVAAGAVVPPGWEIQRVGAAWQVEFASRADPTANRRTAAMLVRFPRQTVSEPGQHLLATTRIGPEPATLRFTWGDSFAGPTSGYHFAEVRLDDVVIWAADVAGEQGGLVSLDLTDHLRGKPGATLGLGVAERRQVTNFAVEVWFSGAELVVGHVATPLWSLPEPTVTPLGPDPSLDLSPPTLSWNRTAAIVQPWGRTQHRAMTEVAIWAPRFGPEFGLDAMIVLPPEAHNANTGPAHQVSPEQWQRAVDAYRAAGLRLILYSSVMHCGHAPAWEHQVLQREHPEWSQRDAAGNPITKYGAEWLCPSTGALDYTIAYTQDLVRRYRPDAVMLDNNEFLSTPAGGWTCYCESCQTGFREYAAVRLGAAAPDRIPTEPGEAYDLWLHFRNRVWAAATERFRAALREIDPGIVLLANTQYRQQTGLLATDLQYPAEDAVLAESRSVDAYGMAEKLTIGRALAAGRPLWNYIGTFDEKDFTRLRPADEVELTAAASLAQHATPWLVFYGFDPPADKDDGGTARLAGLGRLYRRHASALADATPDTPVVSLVSHRDRNHLGRAWAPSHLTALHRAGIAADAIWLGDACAAPDGGFPARLAQVQPSQLLVLEHGLCLSDDEAAALVAWARQGGHLLVAPLVGWHDELGRLREQSVLWQAAGVEPAQPGPTAAGQGSIGWYSNPEALVASLDASRAITLTPPDPRWQLVSWRASDRQGQLLHLLWHGAPDPPPAVTLSLPLAAGTALPSAWVDDWSANGPRPVTVSRQGERGEVALRPDRLHTLVGIMVP